MRKAHYLRLNKRSQRPTHLVFFDTETESERIDSVEVEAKLLFGWACYVRRYDTDKFSEPHWFRFETHDSFWRWIIGLVPDGTKLYAFAHNLAFDFTIVKGFKYLRKRGWKVTGSIIDSPPTSIRLRSGNRTLHFLDTLNYFRVPLKALGESIGLEKYDFPDSLHDRETADRYAMRDVEIIKRAMIDYLQSIKERDLGNFAITQAGQSFNAFRHRFLKHPILIDDNEKALTLSRAAYHGGRVECHILGDIQETVHLLDINSQYPYVMHEHEYPTKLVSVYTRNKISDIADILGHHSIVAKVTINTDLPVYPLVHDGRMIFPIGTFDCALASPELRYAIEHGHIIKVHDMAVYEQAPIFRDYVDYFYKQRLKHRAEGNEAKAYFDKIFMNSLYGKFGQSGLKYSRIGETSDDRVICWTDVDTVTGQVYHMRQYAGVIEQLSRESESRESHPAIAAHVTAYARMLLWQYKVTAGIDNVYYEDTDSLLVNDKGFALLQPHLDSKTLGKLKHELTTDKTKIYAPKDYQLGDKIKRKGIKPKAEEISSTTFAQDQFSTLKGLVRRGDVDRYIIRRVRKTLAREYKKGYIEGGRIVRPFKFNP